MKDGYYTVLDYKNEYDLANIQDMASWELVAEKLHPIAGNNHKGHSPFYWFDEDTKLWAIAEGANPYGSGGTVALANLVAMYNGLKSEGLEVNQDFALHYIGGSGGTDILLINPECERAMQLVGEWKESIADYPLLDEEIWSQILNDNEWCNECDCGTEDCKDYANHSDDSFSECDTYGKDATHYIS